MTTDLIDLSYSNKSMTSFSFSTNPHIIKTIIKLMSGIDYHGYFTVTENGLTGSCINTSNDIGMTFKTNAELTTFKDRITMALSSPDISRLLKRVLKTDKLTLSDTKDEFVITSSGKKMSVVSRVKKLRRQIIDTHFDDVYQDITGVTVDSRSFFTGLIGIGDCDTVNIKQKGTGVVIEMCVDGVRQSVTKLGDTGGQTNFDSNYSLDKLLKLSGVQYASPVLVLYFRVGFPLKVTARTNLGDIDFYLRTTKLSN